MTAPILCCCWAQLPQWAPGCTVPAARKLPCVPSVQQIPHHKSAHEWRYDRTGARTSCLVGLVQSPPHRQGEDHDWVTCVNADVVSVNDSRSPVAFASCRPQPASGASRARSSSRPRPTSRMWPPRGRPCASAVGWGCRCWAYRTDCTESTMMTRNGALPFLLV